MIQHYSYREVPAGFWRHRGREPEISTWDEARPYLVPITTAALTLAIGEVKGVFCSAGVMAGRIS